MRGVNSKILGLQSLTKVGLRFNAPTGIYSLEMYEGQPRLCFNFQLPGISILQEKDGSRFSAFDVKDINMHLRINPIQEKFLYTAQQSFKFMKFTLDNDTTIGTEGVLKTFRSKTRFTCNYSKNNTICLFLDILDLSKKCVFGIIAKDALFTEVLKVVKNKSIEAQLVYKATNECKCALNGKILGLNTLGQMKFEVLYSPCNYSLKASIDIPNRALSFDGDAPIPQKFSEELKLRGAIHTILGRKKQKNTFELDVGFSALYKKTDLAVLGSLKRRNVIANLSTSLSDTTKLTTGLTVTRKEGIIPSFYLEFTPNI